MNSFKVPGRHKELWFTHLRSIHRNPVTGISVL